MAEKYRYNDGYGYEDNAVHEAGTSGERPGGYDDADVFGHEEGHDVCSSHRLNRSLTC